MIKKERIEKSLFGAQLDIDNIFPSINKPCEKILKEISVSGTEQDCSSTKKKNEGLIEKEKEETHKEEESHMTPLQA